VDLICAALKQSRGLQNKAAQLLRIKPTTLFMKIRRHGIDVGAFR
jgi:transcriptional regulator with GAF, ATPase, and Fis domain